MTQENATATAANETGGAAAPPSLPDQAPGPVQGVVDGAASGLEVAGRMAGDVVRSVVPESVIDRIPFLLLDVLEPIFSGVMV